MASNKKVSRRQRLLENLAVQIIGGVVVAICGAFFAGFIFPLILRNWPPLPTPNANSISPTTQVSVGTPYTVSIFKVEATIDKNLPGIYINPGQSVTVTNLSGKWRTNPRWDYCKAVGCSYPGINSQYRVDTLPIPSFSLMALIVGIGGSTPRVVGNAVSFTSSESGVLWLGANDDNFSDNDGSIAVSISVK